MNPRNIFLFTTLLSVFITGSGCAVHVAKDGKEIQEKKTGLYVTANHNFPQFLLYATDGIRIRFKDGMQIPVRWREVRFFEQSPGKIRYNVEMTYLNGSGNVSGCVDLKKDQVLHIHYRSPFIVFSEGNVYITDVKTDREIPFQQNCP